MGFALGMMIPMILSVIFLSKSLTGFPMNSDEIDETVCHPIVGRFNISHWDRAKGRCQDILQMRFCGGLCESSESGTWQFPGSTKVSRVCKPGDDRISKTVSLCKAGVPNMRQYTYGEAISCKCSTCSSSEASCLSATKRGMGKLFRSQLLPIFPIAKDMERRIALAERIIDDSDDDYGLRIIPVLQ